MPTSISIVNRTRTATVQEDMERLRDIIARFSENLPKSVDVAALGVRSKAPFMILSLREALIWRTEELGRNALGCLERSDISAAAILIRAVMENSALLSELVDIFKDKSLTDRMLADRLTPMMFGSREWGDGPQATNILTFVKKVKKKLPGYHRMYEGLSEYAHPNWKGVSMLFSKIDRENHICNFGQQFKPTDKVVHGIIVSLIGAMMMFETLYNHVSDKMPEYLGRLEKF